LTDAKLTQERTILEREKAKLAEPITKLEGEKAGFERELGEFKFQEEKLAQLESVNKQISDKKIILKDVLSPGQIKELENKNAQLQIEMKMFESNAGTLNSIGQSVSSLLKGGIDLITAEYRRKAAFLEADVWLLDTFRGVI
jgi:hypothetical protein